MPPKLVHAFIVTCLACSLLTGPDVLQAHAESLLDKAQSNKTVTVPRGEADMIAAMKKAREKLPAFLALAKAPRPSTNGFALKIAMRHANGIEFFWVNPFEVKASTIIGRVANEPREIPNIKLGQMIEFTVNEVVDWMYRDHGKMKGNYTACVLLKREAPKDAKAFKRKYGLECDF